MTHSVVAIEIPDDLSAFTDRHIAALWHVAQANPAPLDDREAGRIAARVGFEIIRRFCMGVEPELYRHQQEHHARWNLIQFARWDGSEWRLDETKFRPIESSDDA